MGRRNGIGWQHVHCSGRFGRVLRLHFRQECVRLSAMDTSCTHPDPAADTPVSGRVCARVAPAIPLLLPLSGLLLLTIGCRA